MPADPGNRAAGGTPFARPAKAKMGMTVICPLNSRSRGIAGLFESGHHKSLLLLDNPPYPECDRLNFRFLRNSMNADVCNA
jgi:hypothetical protein